MRRIPDLCLALLVAACLAASLAASLAATPATAQIPDEFTNLQVLDGEIEQGQLVGIMKAWSQQLGVRCSHCHVTPDNLQGADFADDAKATKRTARRMLTMAQEINRSLRDLPVLEAEGRRRAQHVKCETCHRGQPKPPRPTMDLLEESLDTGGSSAAIERFETLRSEHADAGRYDLRADPLFHLGRKLLEEGRVDDAKTLLAGMLELFPESADGHVLLGQAHLMAGDVDAAEAQIKEARRIEPENRFSKWLESQVAAQRASSDPEESDPD